MTNSKESGTRSPNLLQRLRRKMRFFANRTTYWPDTTTSSSDSRQERRAVDQPIDFPNRRGLDDEARRIRTDADEMLSTLQMMADAFEELGEPPKKAGNGE